MQKGNETCIRAYNDVKPRNLFNPKAVVKAVLGFINYYMIMLIKKNTSEFVHGKNTGELSEDF
jgi:hypothetical protein